MTAPGVPVVAHRLLLRVLRSSLGRHFGGLVELRFAGRVTGRDIALPVQCARDGTRLVVYVARAGTKRWWRNFLGGHDVRIRIAGADRRGRGRVVDADDRDRVWAEGVYRHRYPRIEPARADPIVVIDLAGGTPADEAAVNAGRRDHRECRGSTFRGRRLVRRRPSRQPGPTQRP